MTYKFYAVAKGRKTGIFTTWGKVISLVEGFHGAIFQGFNTEAEATAFLIECLAISPTTVPPSPSPVISYCCYEENEILKNENEKLRKENEELKNRLYQITGLAQHINDLSLV
jgi:viroplasmin and RNaseH domain-containing protein